jgi:hypothetical protein
LQGLTWQQVAHKLAQRQDPLSQQILGIANTYTAALCKLTHGAPAKVCDTPAIKAASAHLAGG